MRCRSAPCRSARSSTISRPSPARAAQLARAAGTYAMLAGRDQGYALLKLKSGETRMVRADCMATVGAVSNPDHRQRGRRQGRPFALEGRPSAYPAASPATRSTIPMAAVPMAASIGRRPGASRPRARRPATTSRRRSSSCAAATIGRSVRGRPVARSLWKGPFVDGYLLEEGGSRALRRPQRGRSRPGVAALDDLAAVRRPDLSRSTTATSSSRFSSPRTWSVTSSASSRRPGPSMAIRPRDKKATKELSAMSKQARTRALSDKEAQGGDAARSA